MPKVVTFHGSTSMKEDSEPRLETFSSEFFLDEDRLRNDSPVRWEKDDEPNVILRIELT